MNALVVTRAVLAHRDELLAKLAKEGGSKARVRLVCPELPYDAEVEGHLLAKGTDVWFFVRRVHGRRSNVQVKFAGALRVEPGTWAPAPPGEQREVARVRRDGQAEYRVVDTREFSWQLTCPCGRIRYVRPSERDRVTRCRPCTTAARSRASQMRAFSSGVQAGPFNVTGP